MSALARALLLASLAASSLTSQGISQRATSPQVVGTELLRFGGLSDDPDHDLVGIRRLVQVADGRFVIATSTPVAVKVHDSSGRFERRLGRPGEGPGEFRGGVDLGDTSQDAIWLLSTGTRRWMLFGLDGKLRSETPVDSMHPIPDAGVSLHDGYYTRHRLRGSRGCVRRSSAMKELKPLEFAEALTDASGRSWWRDYSDSTLWRTSSVDGSVGPSVRLPAGITIHQFIGDTLIGVVPDDDGADRVVVLEVVLPPTRQAERASCAFADAPSTGVFRDLAIHARNAMVAGMVFQSEARRFPVNLDQMRNYLNITDEARMTTLHASESSWTYAVIHNGTGAVCVASVGPDGLPGWEPGVVTCDSGRRVARRQ